MQTIFSRRPDYKVSGAFIVAISILVGIVAFPYGGVASVIAGVLLLGVPALLAAAVTTPMAGVFGKNVTYNRSTLLSLLSLIIIAMMSLVSCAIYYLAHAQYSFLGFVLALSLVFALRMLVLLGISVNSLPKVIMPASLQTLFSAIVLYYYTQNPAIYYDLVISSIIFMTAAFGFVRYVDYPMVKSFGVSSFDFIQDFIAHLTEGSPAMEEFFEKIGESIDAPVSVLSFKRMDGSTKATDHNAVRAPGPDGRDRRR